MNSCFIRSRLPLILLAVSFLFVAGATWRASAAVKVQAQPQRAAKAGVPSARGMFPVGDVLKDLPQPPHPYRVVPELFPSFVRAGKLWQPTGGFAWASQLDLAPTGSQVGGRRISALANTAAPDRVLFVQSLANPRKFAIYR